MNETDYCACFPFQIYERQIQCCYLEIKRTATFDLKIINRGDLMERKLDTEEFIEELVKRAKPGFQTDLLNTYINSPTQDTIDKFLNERRNNPPQAES